MRKVQPNPDKLVEEQVRDDYLVADPAPRLRLGSGVEERGRSARIHPRQRAALSARVPTPGDSRALQKAVKDGDDRFLFEMATGTGKTLTAAAVIKLFLRTGNASRVLFLVDRLELEEQARKVYLRNAFVRLFDRHI